MVPERDEGISRSGFFFSSKKYGERPSWPRITVPEFTEFTRESLL